jgi:hypothetical protein
MSKNELDKTKPDSTNDSLTFPAQPTEQSEFQIERAVKVAYGSSLFGGSVHESITKEAAKLVDVPYGSLVGGVRWPDFATDNPEKVKIRGVVPENFLVSIKESFEIEQLFSNKKYAVWGLPFYNSENRETEFTEAFDSLLDWSKCGKVFQVQNWLEVKE